MGVQLLVTDDDSLDNIYLKAAPQGRMNAQLCWTFRRSLPLSSLAHAPFSPQALALEGH